MPMKKLEARENDLFANICFDGRGLDFSGCGLEAPFITKLREEFGDDSSLKSLRGAPHPIITNIKNSYGADLRKAAKVLKGVDKKSLKQIVSLVWEDRTSFFKDKVKYYSKDWHKNLFYSEFFYFKEYKDSDKKKLLDKFKGVDTNISFDVIFYCLFWSDIEYIVNMLKILYSDNNWSEYMSWDNPLEQIMQSQRSAYLSLSIANQINGTGELSVSIDESSYKEMLSKIDKGRKKGGKSTSDKWKVRQEKMYDVWKGFPDEIKKSTKLSISKLDLYCPDDTSALEFSTLERYIREWKKR